MMRKHLFIFNFNWLGSAACMAFIFIIGIELLLGNFLTGRYFSHEVDELIYDLEHQRYDEDIVWLGDSVGRQILFNLKEGAMLATNQAIETTGQFFILKRYLKYNKKPKVIVYLSLNPLGKNLEEKVTENYIQRCFTKGKEIWDLYKYKGVKFALVGMIYKFFPSYRYRLHLQKELVGFTNRNIYSGKRKEMPTEPVNEKKRIKKKSAGYAISDRYFQRLVELANKHSISFYYLHAPIPYRSLTDEKQRNHQELYGYMTLLENAYPHFHFVKKIPVYQGEYFLDGGRHLNEKGIKFSRMKLIDWTNKNINIKSKF